VPEPVKADGTDQGIIQNSEEYATITSDAPSHVTNWWNPYSWWPILHMMMEVTIASIVYMIHYTVDLLQSIQLVDLIGGKQPDDAINNGNIDLKMSMAIFSTFQIGFACLAAAEYLWSAFLVPTAAWCFLAAGIAILAGATLWAFSWVGQNLEAGYWTDAIAYFFFLGLFFMMFWIFIGYKSLTGIAATGVMGIYLLSLGLVITGLLDVIREFCKALKFTRLTALLFIAMFGLAAAHHLDRYYGGS
jgi:hypothetical protein